MSDDRLGVSVSTGLSEQADEIITSETDWRRLANQLDVSRYRHRDGHPEWHNGTPFRPMFLAYLWAHVEQESTTGIPNRLEDNPELAEAFGFDPDDLPSESTCKPVRLRDRFDDLQSIVEITAERIREISAERGAPIGYDLGNVASGEDDDPSNRTIQRFLRKKGRHVLDELKEAVLSSMRLPRPENPVYEEDELLVLEAIAAITQTAANGGGQIMGDKKNPDPGLDDSLCEDGPSGETLLEAIKQMSVDQIADVMNFALQKIYTRAKPRLKELESNNGSRFGTRSTIALDITYVAYYGDRDEMEWVQGTPKGKGYEWCHKFATAILVGENTHYVVAVSPLGSTEYADTEAYAGNKEHSYYVGDVARRLLSTANDYVNIKTVYADREFHAADVIYTLEQLDLKYIIPAVKDDSRIQGLCDEFDQRKRGYDEDYDTPLYVKNDYVMHGSVKHGVSNTEVSTNVVVLPPDEDDEANEEDSPQPFLTNHDVSDEIPLDRRNARERIERYQNRAAIENSYSSIKDTAAWTTSKEFEVRWYHFAFGSLVYNLWLLVDFLTQDRIGAIETRKKPRVTLKRFLRWLDKEVVTLL